MENYGVMPEKVSPYAPGFVRYNATGVNPAIYHSDKANRTTYMNDQKMPYFLRTMMEKPEFDIPQNIKYNAQPKNNGNDLVKKINENYKIFENEIPATGSYSAVRHDSGPSVLYRTNP